LLSARQLRRQVPIDHRDPFVERQLLEPRELVALAEPRQRDLDPLEDLLALLARVALALALILFGVALWWIYTYYYPDRSTADIFKYFDDSKVMYDALWKHPADYFKMLFAIGNDNAYFDSNYYSHMNYWYREFDNKIYNDSHTIIRFNAWCSRSCDWLDRWVWGGAVRIVTYLVEALSGLNHSVDAFVVNPSFDQGCRNVTRGGQLLSRLQNGRTQSYLRIVGIAFAALVLFLIWGKRG